MREIDPRRNSLLLGVILLILGGAALAENAGLLVMILLLMLFAVRRMDRTNARKTFQELPDYDDDFEEEWEEISRESRQAQTEPVYRHALESVTRAGLNPDDVQVLTVDIGVMAFRGDQPVMVFRTWSLPDDIDYIQPFVQLRLPIKANGRIKFEILDAKGQTIFLREDTHTLERGRNFITPAARLPIHDQREMDGRWQLRVSADDVLLAVHQLEFAEATNNAISRHIGEDGEINTELKAIMAESQLPKMSLDDLLAYQEDEEQQARQG